MWQDFIQLHRQRTPNKLAIIDRRSSKRLTYEDLDSEVRLWQLYLVAANIKKGDRVAYLAPNRLEHITLFFACCRLGAIFVPLNHRLAPQELAQIIKHIEPGIVIGEDECPFAMDIDYKKVAEINLQDGEAPKAVAIQQDDPLLMLFTSGSTGEPKGVLFHSKMLLANIEQTITTGVLQPQDISIINTPFFHTGGYNVFTLPMFSIGGTLILFEKFEPAGVLEVIATEGVNVFWAVPTMFQAIADEDNFSKTDFSNIRFFLSGGAPLSLPLIQTYHRHGVPFKQGFGLTEVGPNCFLHETEESFTYPNSIGRPMPFSKVRVVDEDGQDVGVDEVGEMLIAGPHLCLGYWRNEEKFKLSMRGEYFATGDLVRVDERGLYYVMGRKKEMYISGGENVFPGEVEKQLVLHPNITQSVVVGVADKKWSEVGFAFFVGDKDIELASLREYLDPILARYKHPHHLKRLAELPLLANGKIDRRHLEKLAQQTSQSKLMS
ncbi:MAG: AMP-binding protein [Magnetococcales bacterium]|nr:AMP-binding protein [Magnetococcales bacterium]